MLQKHEWNKHCDFQSKKNGFAKRDLLLFDYFKAIFVVFGMAILSISLEWLPFWIFKKSNKVACMDDIFETWGCTFHNYSRLTTFWLRPILQFWQDCKKRVAQQDGLRTSDKNLEVGPSSADSANSHHFFFSRVQNAKGIAKNKEDQISSCTSSKTVSIYESLSSI